MSHIIPTIGPAISDSQHLTKLYQDGVRILRFNFSHYSPEKAKPILDIVYETEKLVG
ncbi:TPA: hypothetical protein DEP21_04440 [Patescibacteria group bacterium]|nr:hypothetical protein [Candidatus Gracilibacteria bacterium]